MNPFQEGYQLHYRQMVVQLRINKEMWFFHVCFHYVFYPLYVRPHNTSWRPGPLKSTYPRACYCKLERVCSQTQLCQLRSLMTILDNYMFLPLLAIFRLSLRELKILLYNVRARDEEISISGLRNRYRDLSITRAHIIQ